VTQPTGASSAAREWDYRIALWIVAIATVAVLGIPLSFLLFASLRGPPEFLPIEDGARWTLENFRYVYQDSALYSDIIPNTLIFAAGSVALSSTIALALAWYVERTSLRRPVLTRLLILAPMALPTPALAVAWIRLLGPNAG
jgi:iron(III) transport system permease protein